MTQICDTLVTQREGTTHCSQCQSRRLTCLAVMERQSGMEAAATSIDTSIESGTSANATRGCATCRMHPPHITASSGLCRTLAERRNLPLRYAGLCARTCAAVPAPVCAAVSASPAPPATPPTLQAFLAPPASATLAPLPPVPSLSWRGPATRTGP